MDSRRVRPRSLDFFLFEFVMCLQGVDKVLGESGSENIG